LVRIETKTPDRPTPRRRKSRLVFPMVIGAVVVAAIAILARATFETDEPGQDRSSPSLGRNSSAADSDHKLAARAHDRVLRASPPGTGTPAPTPAIPSPFTAPAPAPAPLSPAIANQKSGGTGAAPARGNRSSAGRGAAARGTAAAGASTDKESGADGAGGVSGSRRAEQKVALVDSAKKDATWQRPPLGEDANSRLVARFTTSGATLKGRVIDSDLAKPSPGVTVEVHIGDAYMRSITDAAGAFRISGILANRRLTVWIIGPHDAFVAERLEVTSSGEGDTLDAGVIRLLRGDELAGHLEGWMGMFVTRRGRRNIVAAVSPWSPADRAGIEVGDVLLSIDGRDVDGLGPRAAGFLLRGPAGSRSNVALQNHAGTVVRYQLERVPR
jgi:hypothetical protein